MMADGVVQIRHFGWHLVLKMTCEQVRRPGETARRDVTFIVFSPSMPSEVFRSDSAAVIKIVSQYSSLSISEYSRLNAASRRNNAKLSGR